MSSIQPLSSDQYRASAERRLPPIEEVADGVLAVPMALAEGSFMPFTYCYVLRGPGTSASVIDPGHGSAQNLGRLRGVLEREGVSRVENILVTHLHSDHVGLAESLRSVTGAQVSLSVVDQTGVGGVGGAVPDPSERMIGWGVPVDDIESARAIMFRRSPVAMPTVGRWLADGDVIDLGSRRLEVISTPGHQPGHLCFRDAEAELLFAGDHVLPTVYPGTQNDGTVSVNPLDRMLDSLEKVRRYDSHLVLPGHGYAFFGLASRIDEIVGRYLARADDVRTVLTRNPAASVWEVAEALRWSGGSIDGLRGTLMFSAALEQTQMHIDRLARSVGD